MLTSGIELYINAYIIIEKNITEVGKPLIVRTGKTNSINTRYEVEGSMMIS